MIRPKGWVTWFLEWRAPREAGLTEQRSPPAPFGGRITCWYSTGPTTPPQPLTTRQPLFPSFYFSFIPASGGTIDIQSEISWKRRLHQNPIDCCDDLKQRSSKQIASTWSPLFSFCCDQSQSTCEISQVCMGLNVGGLRGGHCDKNGCKSFGYIKGEKK